MRVMRRLTVLGELPITETLHERGFVTARPAALPAYVTLACAALAYVALAYAPELGGR
uniref:Uncharacterized protein n=1 Tax=Rhodopseudomonas palustris (strain DX-1) TaxID=652103 RepID=E6VG22_RHOPX